MQTVLFDIVAVIAVILPASLIILFLPVNQWLKIQMMQLLKKSAQGKRISFTHHSPRLLKVWLQRMPTGKWSLLTRYFFCYDQDNQQIQGQAIVSNKTLMDIKYYPKQYQDPYGKLPMLSANDEKIEKYNVVDFNN
jgi:hypothetical protein